MLTQFEVATDKGDVSHQCLRFFCQKIIARGQTSDQMFNELDYMPLQFKNVQTQERLGSCGCGSFWKLECFNRGTMFTEITHTPSSCYSGSLVVAHSPSYPCRKNMVDSRNLSSGSLSGTAEDAIITLVLFVHWNNLQQGFVCRDIVIKLFAVI
jgi:hypothetical protein